MTMSYQGLVQKPKSSIEHELYNVSKDQKCSE